MRPILKAGAALVLAAAVALCACPKAVAPAGDAGAPECATRADCDRQGGDHQGELCSAQGECVPCASDGQCDLRERCDPASLRCAFRTGWGRDCARNDDCQAGQLCVQGLCVAAQQATLCTAGRCLADGQRCNQANGVCEEDIGCLADADCSDVELCNTPTSACVLRCTQETLGQVCQAGQKCVDSRCMDCSLDSDCQGGMVCDRGRLTCVVDGSARCLSDRDCAAGLVCDLAAGFCAKKPPPCLSNEECLKDERCDLASGACVKRACQPDRYEPNSTQADAKPLVAGDYPGLTLCAGEQDWFSIKLSRGDRLSVFVDADSLFQDVMDTRLLDATGRAVAQGKLALDKTVAADGAYFLRLAATDPFIPYGLRLSLSRGTPCDDDRLEPNDAPASATALHDQGDYDKLTLCGLDQDWFLLPVPADAGLLAELHYQPTEGAADLVVWASDGTTQLARSGATATVQTAQVASWAIADGKVLVQVISLDERAHAEYWLHLSFEQGASP